VLSAWLHPIRRPARRGMPLGKTSAGYSAAGLTTAPNTNGSTGPIAAAPPRQNPSLLRRIPIQQHAPSGSSRLVQSVGAERRGRGRSNPHHWICNQRHRLKADVDPRRRPTLFHLWGRGAMTGPQLKLFNGGSALVGPK